MALLMEGTNVEHNIREAFKIGLNVGDETNDKISPDFGSIATIAPFLFCMRFSAYF